MKIIVENVNADIVEKKSRFIANLCYASDENEANNILTAIRKEHYDAKHNCFAYILGSSGEVIKSSDDGEPQGTAGHPMLDILKGSELTNTLAVVTRYFGGVLLGTGGLVRAYSDALKLAVSKAVTTDLIDGYEIDFSVNYDELGKIENLVSQYKDDNSIVLKEKKFDTNITLNYLISSLVFDKIKSDIINITKGRVNINNDIKKTYYVWKHNWKTL